MKASLPAQTKALDAASSVDCWPGRKLSKIIFNRSVVNKFFSTDLLNSAYGNKDGE